MLELTNHRDFVRGFVPPCLLRNGMDALEAWQETLDYLTEDRRPCQRDLLTDATVPKSLVRKANEKEARDGRSDQDGGQLKRQPAEKQDRPSPLVAGLCHALQDRELESREARMRVLTHVAVKLIGPLAEQLPDPCGTEFLMMTCGPLIRELRLLHKELDEIQTLNYRPRHAMHLNCPALACKELRGAEILERSRDEVHNRDLR